MFLTAKMPEFVLPKLEVRGIESTVLGPVHVDFLEMSQLLA